MTDFVRIKNGTMSCSYLQSKSLEQAIKENAHIDESEVKNAWNTVNNECNPVQTKSSSNKRKPD